MAGKVVESRTFWWLTAAKYLVYLERNTHSANYTNFRVQEFARLARIVNLIVDDTNIRQFEEEPHVDERRHHRGIPAECTHHRNLLIETRSWGVALDL